MKLKKEYVFIIINYTIIFLCWIIFDSGIAREDIIIGLLTVLVHVLLLLGGEGIIYFIFSLKNDARVVLKVLSISLFINVCIYALSSSSNYLIGYILLNQIIGVIIGRICCKIKNR